MASAVLEAPQSETSVVGGRLVTFFGASDDLVEVAGDIPGCDEYCVGPGGAAFEVGGLYVEVKYEVGKSGCWGITVGQIDEDVPVLARVDGLRAEGYTMKLTLVVPMGAYVSKVS